MSRIVVVVIAASLIGSAASLIGSAASLIGSAALAQDAQQPAQQPQNSQSDPVAAVVGAWELSNADHDKTCRLNFRADAAPGGNRIRRRQELPKRFSLDQGHHRLDGRQLR